MTGRDLRLFLVLACCVAGYLIARAALVPWVHDECASLFWYAEPGVFLPPYAHADANNHILSSALGALSLRLFGLTLLASRLGSLLAFGLYAVAVWRLGAFVRSGPLRWCLWSALLFCPFLFEFFALFRGYGLELAFLAVALDGGLRWTRIRSSRSFAQLLAGIALADLSVLALVPLWALLIAFLAVVLVLLRHRFQRRALLLHAALWLFIGLLPLLWGVDLAFDLRAKGLLYHGSTAGLLPVTIASLNTFVLGRDGPIIRLVVVLLAAFPLGVTIALNAWRRPLGIVSVALSGDVLLRILLAQLLDVNYPEDRAALHLLWLVLFAAALALDELAASRKSVRWCGLPLLLLPLRGLVTINVDHTALWPEQSVPERFVVRLDAMQRAAGRPLVVGAYHQLAFALPYAVRDLGRSPLSLCSQHFPEGADDVRIVDDRFLAEASAGFTELDASPTNRLHLLARTTPLRKEPLLAFMTKQPDPGAENFEVWATRADHRVYLVEVRCLLPVEGRLQDLLLVAASQDAEGNELSSEAVHPSIMDLARSDGRYALAIRFDPLPNAVKHLVYFWNGTKHPVRIDAVDVRVSALN
ncbi:MAG: hypothetical protein IPK99_10455 [Flavobacteriales bacterium]|nr:hypothetical protein [Flavobacteriales bacterium]